MLTLLAAILFYVTFMWAAQKRRRQMQAQAAMIARRRTGRLRLAPSAEQPQQQ